MLAVACVALGRRGKATELAEALLPHKLPRGPLLILRKASDCCGISCSRAFRKDMSGHECMMLAPRMPAHDLAVELGSGSVETVGQLRRATPVVSGFKRTEQASRPTLHIIEEAI